MTAQRFVSDVIAIVRAMDDEADTTLDRYRCGLPGYRSHVGIKSHELAWTRGIVTHLKTRGYDAVNEHPYPGDRTKCDVVATLTDGVLFWLEVKPTWRAWITKDLGVERNADQFYRGYLFGPNEGGLPRSHSIAQDIDKLDLLEPPHAHFVGLLVLGFDEREAGVVEADLDRLSDTKRLNQRAWRTEGPVIWPDRNSDACTISCRVWWRKTAPN